MTTNLGFPKTTQGARKVSHSSVVAGGMRAPCVEGHRRGSHFLAASVVQRPVSSPPLTGTQCSPVCPGTGTQGRLPFKINVTLGFDLRLPSGTLSFPPSLSWEST